MKGYSFNLMTIARLLVFGFVSLLCFDELSIEFFMFEAFYSLRKYSQLVVCFAILASFFPPQWCTLLSPPK